MRRLPVVDECGFESCCDDGGVGAGNYNKSSLTTSKAAMCRAKCEHGKRCFDSVLMEAHSYRGWLMEEFGRR